jgi:hypothetical protein
LPQHSSPLGCFERQHRHSAAGEESPLFLSFQKTLKNKILHFAAGWQGKVSLREFFKLFLAIVYWQLLKYKNVY